MAQHCQSTRRRRVGSQTMSKSSQWTSVGDELWGVSVEVMACSAVRCCGVLCGAVRCCGVLCGAVRCDGV